MAIPESHLGRHLEQLLASLDNREEAITLGDAMPEGGEHFPQRLVSQFAIRIQKSILHIVHETIF